MIFELRCTSTRISLVSETSLEVEILTISLLLVYLSICEEGGGGGGVSFWSEVLHTMSLVAHTAGAYPGFLSMMQLGVLLPPWMGC